MNQRTNPRQFKCTACADLGYMTFSFGQLDCYLCKPATVLGAVQTTNQPVQENNDGQDRAQGDGPAPEPA